MSLITKFLLNLPPCLPQQRGCCHGHCPLSSQRCHHCAHRLALKHNHSYPDCFRRNRICPGCAQCHPDWWQHPAAANGSEMSLRIGLQMIKYTIALALAIKIFAVAGREKQCSSSGRCPAMIPLKPKAFPCCAQKQILRVTSHLQSISRRSQSPYLSYLCQSKAPTALGIWFIWFPTTSWSLYPLNQVVIHTLHQEWVSLGKVVLCRRTHPCPEEAGFTLAVMGRSVLETTTSAAVSKSCLHALGSSLSSWGGGWRSNSEITGWAFCSWKGKAAHFEKNTQHSWGWRSFIYQSVKPSVFVGTSEDKQNSACAAR